MVHRMQVPARGLTMTIRGSHQCHSSGGWWRPAAWFAFHGYDLSIQSRACMLAPAGMLTSRCSCSWSCSWLWWFMVYDGLCWVHKCHWGTLVRHLFGDIALVIKDRGGHHVAWTASEQPDLVEAANDLLLNLWPQALTSYHILWYHILVWNDIRMQGGIPMWNKTTKVKSAHFHTMNSNVLRVKEVHL